MKYRGVGLMDVIFRGIPRKFRYFVGKVRIRSKLLYVARKNKNKSTGLFGHSQKTFWVSQYFSFFSFFLTSSAIKTALIFRRNFWTPHSISHSCYSTAMSDTSNANEINLSIRWYRNERIFVSFIIFRSPMPEEHQEKVSSMKLGNTEIKKREGRINTR